MAEINDATMMIQKKPGLILSLSSFKRNKMDWVKLLQH